MLTSNQLRQQRLLEEKNKQYQSSICKNTKDPFLLAMLDNINKEDLENTTDTTEVTVVDDFVSAFAQVFNK